MYCKKDCYFKIRDFDKCQLQSIEEESQVVKPTRVHFSYPEEGHTKCVIPVFCSLQKLVDADKHLIRLERTATRERGLNSDTSFSDHDLHEKTQRDGAEKHHEEEPVFLRK